jgi:hypothetical protein
MVPPLPSCSVTKARFRDWAALHQKYGAANFLSVPLETGAGVLGALTAAGSPQMERRAVEALAARLAEALLRRTMEGLLKASAWCPDDMCLGAQTLMDALDWRTMEGLLQASALDPFAPAHIAACPRRAHSAAAVGSPLHPFIVIHLCQRRLSHAAATTVAVPVCKLRYHGIWQGRNAGERLVVIKHILSKDCNGCVLQEATEQLQGGGGPEAARSLATRFPQVDVTHELT